MSCQSCGAPTTNRLCNDCRTLDRMESDPSFASGDELDDDREYVEPSNCHAIIPSSGRQCTSSHSTDDRLCGTHAKTGDARLSRVDDVPGAPFVDLRDRLVDVDMHGSIAYVLATRFKTGADLWNAATALEPVEIGDRVFDVNGMATHAKKIAKLDDVDAGAHPFAEETCIAITGSGSRCTSSGYGTSLLCGMHTNANDPETIYDQADAPDFPAREHEGVEYLVVGPADVQGDDVVAINTDEWDVERLVDAAALLDDESEQDERDSVEQDVGDDMTDATPATDEPDDQAADERPDALEGVEQGDPIRVTLENGETIDGDVDTVELDDFGFASIFVFVNGDDGEQYSIHASKASGEWDGIGVNREWLDADGEEQSEHIGRAAAVENRNLEKYDPDEPGEIDPFVFESRVDELESVGLSGREAQVVACKESGMTHPMIAEYLDLPKSTVDEYSRRARTKVLDARALVGAVGTLYD